MFERLKFDNSIFHDRADATSVWLLRLCLVAVTAIATPSLGSADDRATFQDLLTRAQAQAASGHRWSPPGNNMTETISAMMDLIPTATPKQLADLSALLESDPSRPTPPPPQAQAVEPVASETAIAATPDALRPPPAIDPEPVDLKPPPAIAPEPVAAKPSSAIASEPLAPKPSPVIASEPLAPKPSPAISSEPLAPKPPPVIASEPVAPKPSPGIVSEALAPKPSPVIASEALAPKPSPVIASEALAPKPLPAPVAIRPSPRAEGLFARGQEAERQGDVSGARRLYATAASQGSATAARSLGRLYDPGYLKQTALGGIDADPALARHWYERAVAMGDTQATPLLQALAAR